MPFKLSKEQRDALRADRSKLSMPQLIEKYGISRATVHRVLGESRPLAVETKQEVSMPTPDDYSEFAEVITGKASREPERKVEQPEDPLFSKATERLADNLFAEPELPPVLERKPKQESVREDPLERNAVTQRIVLNLENFAPMFAFVHDKAQFIKSLHSRSVSDLKGILATMEQTRTTINLANQLKQSFFMVSKATEVLGSRYLSLKTDGFHESLQSQKQELDMIFRELAIEYAPRFTFQTRPEMRLGLMYVMTLLQVDNSNRIKQFAEAAKQDVPQATAESFADL